MPNQKSSLMSSRISAGGRLVRNNTNHSLCNIIVHREDATVEILQNDMGTHDAQSLRTLSLKAPELP
jgi:hypothetical protein